MKLSGARARGARGAAAAGRAPRRARVAQAPSSHHAVAPEPSDPAAAGAGSSGGRTTSGGRLSGGGASFAAAAAKPLAGSARRSASARPSFAAVPAATRLQPPSLPSVRELGTYMTRDVPNVRLPSPMCMTSRK